jgi:hypothetical protein
MTITSFQLTRNPFGQLVLINADGQTFEGVNPVRAFPIQAPHDGIAIVCADGKEVAWIDNLLDLSQHARELIEGELAGREFMPEIQHITQVTSFATPCTWDVKTDRGNTHFVLKGEEDIRRIGSSTLLIADSHGIHFLIRDMQILDKHSRKILDRFL